MKKKLLTALVSSALICGGVQAEASSSFFADVPADNWSYSAVNDLISTGKVPGYNQQIPDGRIMSRMEMAMIVDEAMKNKSSFSSEQQATLDRLSQEYFYDIKKVEMLKKIDSMDTSAIDKPAASGEAQFTPEEVEKIRTLANRVEITGFAQIRHDHTIENTWTPNPTTTYTKADGSTGYHYPGVGDKTRSKPSTYVKADVYAHYKINDDWKAVAGLNIRGNTDQVDDFTWSGGENSSTVIPLVWLEGKVGGGTGAHIKAGRWNEWTPMGWGYDIDCDVAAIQITLGKPIFHTVLTAGQIDLWDNYNSSAYLQDVRGYETDEETNFAGIRWDYNPNDNTSIHFGFHGMDAMTSRYQDDKKKNHVLYYYVHGQHKFNNIWTGRAGIINSNAKMIDHPWGDDGPQVSKTPGFWLEAQYKNANPADPGSYRAFATYRKEPGATWVTVTDWWPKNTQGYRLGLDYIVAKNLIFTTWADKLKEIDTKAKHTRYRFQMQFNFE